MKEVQMFTAAVSVLALACVLAALIPQVAAWLDWAMGWALGIGVGGPLLVWAGRTGWAEVGVAREFARARPRANTLAPVEREVSDR